jgi:hypothetical protein
MKLEEYTLPSLGARSRRIAVTGDDAVWSAAPRYRKP